MLARATLLALALGLVTCGSLGVFAPRDEIPFDAIERAHFDAWSATRDTGAPSATPLMLRVHLMGDGADADLSASEAWLLRNANVRVVHAADGAPLFLTRLDLSATSGRATLGATVPTGMAVEVSDARVYPCVATHEMLHFLGLTHVADARNIMSPQCTPGKLGSSELSPEQRAQLDAVRDVRASTVGGGVVWAARASS